MPTLPTDQAGLKKYIDDLKAGGATESTSKALNKAVIALKQFTPEKFDREAGGGNLAQLQRGVEDPTPEPGEIGSFVQGLGGNLGATSGFGFGPAPQGIDLSAIHAQAFGSEDIQNIEAELKEKQDALNVALTNINDNPFYSEATRTGKIAKLMSRPIEK